jgi:hypothetical protein
MTRSDPKYDLNASKPGENLAIGSVCKCNGKYLFWCVIPSEYNGIIEILPAKYGSIRYSFSTVTRIIM